MNKNDPNVFYTGTDSCGIPWYMWLMQPNAIVTMIKEDKMDQSELMQVRDTLDSVVQGPHDIDDVVSALELVESYIETNTEAMAPMEVVAEDQSNGSEDTA